MNKDIILSVCIPTYNGGNRIEKCLDALAVSFGKLTDVEVVVSDNGSTDNTSAILENYSKIGNYKVYHNQENLGFNENIRLLIDQYAKGKYCWIIGDDDYIDPDAIERVREILLDKKPEFISVRHRVLSENDFQNFSVDASRVIETQSASYFKCIDLNASKSNLLATFMSSQIYLLEPVRNFDKSIFGNNNWKGFKDVFPNSYMMTSIFHHSESCCCILTPILTAISHPKSWDDKLSDIYLKILPDYYKYCRGVSGDEKMTNTNRVLKGLMHKYNLDAIIHLKWNNLILRDLFSFSFLSYLFKKANLLSKTRF